MSNRFKSLDSYTPNRGEVVCVSLCLLQAGERIAHYSWKRKISAVTSAVNAFHMHRGLCREFSNENSWIAANRTRAYKKLVGDLVEIAYCRNYVTNQQYFTYIIDIDTLQSFSPEEERGRPMDISQWLFWSHANAQSKVDGKSRTVPSGINTLSWELLPYDWAAEQNLIIQAMCKQPVNKQ